jgi:hypothetical protein
MGRPFTRLQLLSAQSYSRFTVEKAPYVDLEKEAQRALMRD